MNKLPGIKYLLYNYNIKKEIPIVSGGGEGGGGLRFIRQNLKSIA